MKDVKLKGLYAITDPYLTPYQNGEIFVKVEKALKGGTKLLQLRDKHTSIQELFPIAMELKKLCVKYEVLFIINDNIELVLKTDADGLHVGKDDIDPVKARKILGENKILGISCYGDIQRAKDFEKYVDYVSFGSVYPSPTKPEAICISKDVIKEAKKVLKIPICAIGGITPERAKELIALGIDMVAVISALWKSNNIEEKARMLLKKQKKC